MTFKQQAEFPHGLLPTRKDTIKNVMYLLRPSQAGKAQRSKNNAANLLAETVQEHWLFCNLYTITNSNIRLKILKLYQEFITLGQTRKQRQNESYDKKVADFNKKALELFDIFCENATVRNRLGKHHGVKMTEMEWTFLEDQRSSRKMYCEDFVDRKWMKTMERRWRDMQALDNMRQEAPGEQDVNQDASGLIDSEQSDCESEQNVVDEVEYNFENSTDSDEPSSSTGSAKKRRKVCHAQVPHPNDDMPERYRHVRDSLRKVRPELYETVDNLKSSYHMSENQAAAAVVTVGNKMFGRTWKMHNESNVIDLDTLPHYKNVKQAGKCIETLAIDEIVKEIMGSHEKTVVTYSDDGSKKQGAGSFSVQGITVNGVYRSLPTLSIASESRTNLADLKFTVLGILEAASGVEAKILYEKIDFVITD